MKHLKLTSLLCGGILSVAGSTLLGQQSSSTDPSSSTSLSSSSLGQSTSSSMHQGKNVRLSHLMNQTVQSQEGKSLGYIRDLVVDPQNGRIDFALLSLSSAGAATDTSTSGRETVPSSRSTTTGTPSSSSEYSTTGKLIPVPWQLFSQSWNNRSSLSSSSSSSTLGAMSHPLVLNIDESKLRSAPSFDATNWSEFHNGGMDQRVYSYFGVDRNWATGTAGSSISGQGTSGTYDPNRRSSTGTNPQGNSTTSPSTSPDK